jgi:hypothetical protein
MASVSAFAEAPIITPSSDIIIGDLEQGDANNVFIFESGGPVAGLTLSAMVTDDNTADGAIKWSYMSTDAKIVINGAAQLSGGDPNSPLAGENLNLTDNDQPAGVTDGSADTITFRNQDLSPGLGSLGPYADPGTSGVLASETRTITLFASDCSTYSQVDIVVYTANSTSDSLSGGNLLTPVIDLDFENDPNDISGWFGGVVAGMGMTSTTTGLCMTVNNPDTAGSNLGWISPPNFTPSLPNWIQLVDKALYRMRATMMTNQTANGAIPYVDFVWSNFLLSTGVNGNNYGGLYWLLDVAGGATGVGRFQSDFDVWVTPNSALTQQWRGVIDASNSAFDPSVDFTNDWSVTMRILHDNSSINTQADSGTICLRRIRVDRCSLDSLSTTVLQNSPIIPYNSGGIMYRDPDDAATAGGSFTIAGGVANLNLTPNPTSGNAVQARGARRKLQYWIGFPGNVGNTAFFPQLWERGKLYMTRIMIRSNVGGPSGTVEGTDPVDTIFIDFDCPNSEFGSFHFTAKGNAGNMNRATSPRLSVTTGGAQPYIGFLQGTEPSKGATLGLPDSDRVRSYVDFFNVTTIGTATDGLDAMTIESVEVLEVDTSVLQ